MKRAVVVTSRAHRHVEQISRWLADRSPQGAARWIEAYDQMIERLEDQADRCALAPESKFVAAEVRHIFFKTPRGRVYRALFTITNEEVQILGIRGPGQQLESP